MYAGLAIEQHQKSFSISICACFFCFARVPGDNAIVSCGNSSDNECDARCVCRSISGTAGNIFRRGTLSNS